MRWIQATKYDGSGDIWINMAQVLCIGIIGDCTAVTFVHGEDLRVKEAPEHLVAPFR